MQRVATHDRQDLVRAGEVAMRFGTSTATVGRLRRAGVLPAVRVGAQWRFRRADIDRIIAETGVTYPSTSEDPGRDAQVFSPAGDGGRDVSG